MRPGTPPNLGEADHRSVSRWVFDPFRQVTGHGGFGRGSSALTNFGTGCGLGAERSEMLPREQPDHIHVAFDGQRLTVASAGLLLPII